MQDGETPLHYAARGGHSDVVALLLEWDADMDAKTNVSAPKRPCCWPPPRPAGTDRKWHTHSLPPHMPHYMDLLTIESTGRGCFLRGGEVTHVQGGAGGLLPMQFGGAASCPGLACPYNATQDQKTPLHFAARGGSRGVAALLLDAGADMEATDTVSVQVRPCTCPSCLLTT